jgi:type II secretory pathway predicted ATPase ExeA
MPRANFLPATATVLRLVLQQHSISQVAIKKACNVSEATISLIVNRHQYPATNPAALKEKIAAFLAEKGVAPDTIANAMDNNLAACPQAAELFATAPPRIADPFGTVASTIPTHHSLEQVMIPKTRLTQEAKKHFALFVNPFDGAINSVAEYYRSPDIMYVREAVWDAAQNSRFVVVVGESGSGKSTLRQDLHERIKAENKRIIIAEPYVLAMEGHDFKGKQTLSSTQIAHSLIAAINPGVKVKINPQAMFKQLHNLLIEQHEQGTKVALVIEEAHGLPQSTLKHLKRFLELQTGFTTLLGVILIGQPEMRQTLSSHNAAVREVFGRAEIVDMPPLDNYLQEYLAFKLNTIKRKVADFFEPDAVGAILSRLSVPVRSGGARSLCYPLMVNNLMTHLLNAGAVLHQKIDADLIDATQV